ncbi:MAG: hypothetical protein AAF564_22265 [Bacteroidota bacterium]
MAERLAWAAACPHGPVGWPSGKSEGVGPAADSGEEVALGVLNKLIWSDIFNTPRVHIAGGYQSRLD